MNNNSYQQKYKRFQDACLLDENDIKSLKDTFSKRTARDKFIMLKEGVYILLEKKYHQAAVNFVKTLGRVNTDVLKDFCRKVFNNAEPGSWDDSQWQQFAEFVRRLAADAPYDDNNARCDALCAIKSIISSLIDKIDEFKDAEGLRLTWEDDTNVRILEDFFDKYKLFDPDNKKAEISIEEGVRDYLYEVTEKLKESGDMRTDGVTADYVTVRNNLKQAYNIDEEDGTEQAIKILMCSAPDSIWETKCLQAGISSFKWVEVKR